MEQSEFQDLVLRTAARFAEDSRLFALIAAFLPPLPPKCEYRQLQGCVIRSVADLELTIFVPDRLTGASLINSFTPLPASWLPNMPPVFRPTVCLNPDDHLNSKAIFPVLYTAFYDPNLPEDGGRYQANLTWFWQPVPNFQLRIVINLSILNDEGRCYRTDITGLPEGQVETMTNERTGARNANVIWPHDEPNWIKKLVEVTDDEWPMDIMETVE